MISYVLLIFITISLSIGVYIWLKDYATITEKINCKEGTSLTIEKYSIEQKGAEMILNLSIKNNGLFNVSGFLISAGNDSKKIPMQLIWAKEKLLPQGYFIFIPELGPGQKQNAEFLITEFNKLEIIQMQPYIFEKDNIDKIFCEQALIKQVILINPSLIPELISWWKFDGNVLDYGFGNDGTNTGSIFVSGKVNQGLKFDGVDDYVNINDNPSLNPISTMTVFAWVNATEFNNNLATVVKKADANAGYALEKKDGDNVLKFYVNIGGSWFDSGATSILSTNRWYNIIGTYDGANIKIYVNGVLNSTGAASGNIKASSNSLAIGRDSSNPDDTFRHWKGVIDEVAIYNKALSDWEVLQLYNSYNITT